MTINYAKFVMIASLTCGLITCIICSDNSEYFADVPTVVKNNLPDAQKDKILLWTQTIMENKTISQAASLFVDDLNKQYSGNWVAIVGPNTYAASVRADNTKCIQLDYHKNSIFICNSVC